MCGSLALAACGGDDDASKASAANGGGSPGKTSLPDLGGGSGSKGDVPGDACAALPKDQVDALVPGAKLTGPESANGGGIAHATCSWHNDTVTLTLSYTAGVPNAQLLMSMNGEVQDAHGDKTTIAGDDAGVWSAIPGNVQVAVVHDDVYVTVELLVLGTGAQQHRDQLVALAEAAVGSL